MSEVLWNILSAGRRAACSAQALAKAEDIQW